MHLRKAAFAACLLCAGCVSAGTRVTTDQVADFKRGEATLHTVRGELGEPTTITVLSDGSETDCYTFVQSAARPESFIPVAGLFIGGADSRADSTCFEFSKDGVLKATTSSTSRVRSRLAGAQ